MEDIDPDAEDAACGYDADVRLGIDGSREWMRHDGLIVLPPRLAESFVPPPAGNDDVGGDDEKMMPRQFDAATLPSRCAVPGCETPASTVRWEGSGALARVGWGIYGCWRVVRRLDVGIGKSRGCIVCSLIE